MPPSPREAPRIFQARSCPSLVRSVASRPPLPRCSDSDVPSRHETVTPASPGASCSAVCSSTTTAPSSWRTSPASRPSQRRRWLRCQCSREESHPASSSALAIELSRWRTSKPWIRRSAMWRSGRSNAAARRSRHGVVRSQARSTMYAYRRRCSARANASAGSSTSSESTSITSISGSSAWTASSCPCGDHTTVGISLTSTGSTIVCSARRCPGPRSISTFSCMTPSALPVGSS